MRKPRLRCRPHEVADKDAAVDAAEDAFTDAPEATLATDLATKAAWSMLEGCPVAAVARIASSQSPLAEACAAVLRRLAQDADNE